MLQLLKYCKNVSMSYCTLTREKENIYFHKYLQALLLKDITLCLKICGGGPPRPAAPEYLCNVLYSKFLE